MNKKILLSFVLLSFFLLSFIPIQNKKSIALASSSFVCITVTGGCTNTHSSGDNTAWESPSATGAACNVGKDIAAVKCPNSDYVLGGGCSASSSNSRISHECPTDDPQTGINDESKSCSDYATPSMYSWFFCNWGDSADKVTAYAICCPVT